MPPVRSHKGSELHKYSPSPSSSYSGKGNLKTLCIIFTVSTILPSLNHLKEPGPFLSLFQLLRWVQRFSCWKIKVSATVLKFEVKRKPSGLRESLRFVIRWWTFSNLGQAPCYWGRAVSEWAGFFLSLHLDIPLFPTKETDCVKQARNLWERLLCSNVQ